MTLDSLLRLRPSLLLRLVPLVVAACGGGSDGPSIEAVAPAGADKRIRAQAMFAPTASIAAETNTRGMWSRLISGPLMTVQPVLVPDAKLLSYSTNGSDKQTGNLIVDGSDPEGALSGMSLNASAMSSRPTGGINARYVRMRLQGTGIGIGIGLGLSEVQVMGR